MLNKKLSANQTKLLIAKHSALGILLFLTIKTVGGSTLNKCCHDVFWRKHNHKKSTYDSHITLVTKDFIYYLIGDLHSIAKSCQNSLIITKRTAIHRGKAAQKKKITPESRKQSLLYMGFSKQNSASKSKTVLYFTQKSMTNSGHWRVTKLLPTNSNFQ